MTVGTDGIKPATAVDTTGAVDATALLARLAAGDTTAVEVARTHLELIAGRGARLNAVVQVSAKVALAEAEAIDARRSAGEPLGPLAGVPMTVKDAFDVAGMTSSDGRASTVHVSGQDAPAVARLRSAGAVLLGKTNVPPLLGDTQTNNDVYGRTLNPWDLAGTRTPGGSSGGSAAAVAAGLSLADLGSDLGGSIRVPAAWCGVFGHRPTDGVVSKRGHLPWPVDSRLEPPFSVSGPLARSARDLELLLPVLAGSASMPGSAWTLELPAATRVSLVGLRVGLWLGADGGSAGAGLLPVDEETATAVHALGEALAAAGAIVLPFEPPADPAELLPLFDRLTKFEIAHEDPRQAGPLIDVWRDVERREEVAQEWDARFSSAVDVMLAPVVPCAAPVHREVPADVRRILLDGASHPAAVVTSWSRVINAVGATSTVVPLGLGASSGLPLAAQLVGPRFDDLEIIRVAALAESAGVLGRLSPPGW